MFIFKSFSLPYFWLIHTHLIKDWEPESVIQLSTKLHTGIYEFNASSVTMPCIEILAWKAPTQLLTRQVFF